MTSDFVDTLKRMITATVDSIRVMSLDELRPFGNGKLVLRHPSGNKIEINSQGAFYNGVEIGTGTGTGGDITGLTNPLTEDLVTNGYAIKSGLNNNIVFIVEGNGGIQFKKVES